MCILKYGSILAAPRNFICSKSAYLKELFSCSLCLGFWSGVTVAVFVYYLQPPWDNKYFLFPFLSAVMCWTADSVIGIFSYTERYMASK